MLRRVSSARMLAFICLFYIGASMAHPFTPTLFTNLGMPDYMFGLAYACMSVMGFLMGPFWGKVSDSVGKVPVMVIGCAGYAIGQLLFSVSTTIPTILLARMFSGVFCNATIICALAYISDNASARERSSLLAWQAALIAVFSALGYLIGGVLGDISIPMAFHVQSGVMLADGVLIALLLKDSAGSVRLPEAVGTGKRSGGADVSLLISTGRGNNSGAEQILPGGADEEGLISDRDGHKALPLREVLRESNPFKVFAQFPAVLREVSEAEAAQERQDRNAKETSGAESAPGNRSGNSREISGSGSMQGEHSGNSGKSSGRLSPAARMLLFLFVTAAFAALATTCFDSSFNYYIKAEFDFPSTYNGIIKAAVGIIGFIADATICMWLIRRPHPERILSLIYAGCAAVIAFALTARVISVFLAICILYYTLNSLYLPIQQSLVMRGATERNSGTVSGLFNSVRFVGNVTGSLSAGFLYTVGSTIPFIVAAVIFAGTALAGAAAGRISGSRK